MRAFYEVGYRFFRMPWEGGPRAELVALVESGRIQPCRALDLGCGTGLAGECFKDAAKGGRLDGVDISSSMIEEARKAK